MSGPPIPKNPPAMKIPKPLRRKSTKTAERDARYARERDEFLSAHPTCQAHWPHHCTIRATEVHHMGGRAPSVFFRKAWWLAVCGGCHRQITDNPNEAIARGLSIRRNEVQS